MKSVSAGGDAAERAVRVHIKTNTGMNRFGCDGAALTRTAEILKHSAGVRVEGIFSHLAGVSNIKNAAAQRDLFVKHCAVAEKYFGRLTRHLSATAGACLSEDYYFDMVRVGLGLYGYLPDGCLPLVAQKPGRGGRPFSPVRPAMKAYARCIESRTYASGEIGYGERTGVPGEKLHAVNAGYGGGFFRRERNGMSGGTALLRTEHLKKCGAAVYGLHDPPRRKAARQGNLRDEKRRGNGAGSGNDSVRSALRGWLACRTRVYLSGKGGGNYRLRRKNAGSPAGRVSEKQQRTSTRVGARIG